MPLSTLRSMITVALCFSGLAFEIATANLNLIYFITFAIRVFLVHPFLDYWCHRLLHRYKHTMLGQYHRGHHAEIKTDDSSADEFEVWCYLMAALTQLHPYTTGAGLGFLQYAFFHQLSHDQPTWLPSVSRHHGIHHLAPDKNHSITMSWPDCVFGTQLDYVPKELVVSRRVAPMLGHVHPPMLSDPMIQIGT
jgi:sterol desaturase/sphingolipid hydroxylase (fatty acid hydroxylase superfamily)